MTISSAPGRYPELAGTEPAGTESAELTDEELHSFVVSPLAACADSALDPDDWFPIVTAAARARAEASSALAVCLPGTGRVPGTVAAAMAWRGATWHLGRASRDRPQRSAPRVAEGGPGEGAAFRRDHRPPATAAEAT
jgi:hypothetical protein